MLRRMIADANRQARVLQSQIDKLDATEIEIAVSEDEIDNLREMFDTLGANALAHLRGRF